MKPRILIVGGSMGGLFAAFLLGRAGFDVTVAERSQHGLEGQGAGLVAQREVFAMLREAGVEHGDAFGVTARERIFLDAGDAVIGIERTPQTQLSWDSLFRTFRERISEESYRLGARAAAIESDGSAVGVRYADGRSEAADIVVGADGIGSLVRAFVSGAESRPRYVGYATWRGLVPEKQMPVDAAQRLFDRLAFFDGPGSHMLGYLVPGADGSTVPGRRRYNWVWYRPYAPDEIGGLLVDREGVRHPFSLGPGQVHPEIEASLRRDAAERLPPSLAAAVTAEPRPFLSAIHDYSPDRMVKGRVALLGDAAFVARPHTAMGVAKAAGDAFALRDALLHERDLDAALRAYDAARVPVGQSIVAYGQRLGGQIGLGTG